MQNKSSGRYVCLIILFSILSGAKAADMTITNLSPSNNAVEVCADAKLRITFATTPIVPYNPNLNLQICRVSDNNVVYQLDLLKIWSPPTATNTFPPDMNTFVWPYQINLNGRILYYEPFKVNGNTLEIHPSMYPSATRFDYNTTYYVKMSAGFCTDANGDTSPAITDNTTWRFTTKTAAPATDNDYTVALDGSGDFCTMQGAADAVVNSDPCRTIIKIKKGTYRELISITSGKTNMTWLGEDKDQTIISAYNCDVFNGGSDNRMVIRDSANGHRYYNLTLHNLCPDGGSQAETIKHSGQKSIVKNCNFKSYQDTLCLNGQMYLKNCYIEGDTDYIWGYGTIYFDGCEMRSLSVQSYITQPRASKDVNGLILVDCNLTSPAGLTGCYLGRTVNNGYPYCQSVFINCTMPSTLILPVGWKITTDTNTAKLRWWEYKSVDTSGNLIDVSGRASYTKQLNDAEAAHLRDVTHIFGTWNPKAIEPPTPSWEPYPANESTAIPADGATLTFAAGAEAETHRIYFGFTNPPEFATEQTGTSLATGPMFTGTTYYWRIDEKNSAGTTAGPVWSFTTTGTPDSTKPSPDPMAWASVPGAIDHNTITMTAAEATDISGVEYYFTNITDTNHNSGWQDNVTYTDTGLVNNKTYTYKVKARDKSPYHNETADSNEASATTPRYDCTSALLSDLDSNCQIDFFDFAMLGEQWAEETFDFSYLEKMASEWLLCNRNPANQCWQ